MFDIESRPLLLLLATLVSLLTAGVLSHALNTSRSRDGLLGWGWVFAGAVGVATGLWSTQSLGLVGSRLGGPQQFTFTSMALAWCASFAAAAASLLAARVVRSQRLRLRVLPWILSLIFAVAIGVTVRVLPVGSELASWSVGWALAAVALLGVSTLFTIWFALAGGRYWTNADGAPAATPGVVSLGIGLSCAHALALQGMEFRPVTTDLPPAATVDALGLTVAASVGALAVAVAVLGALFDWRNRVHNRSLATSLDEANTQLRRQAFCDPLTELPNRLLFEDRMNQTLQRVGRAPGAMAVLFIDLDGFKPINDSFGHAAGDVVLREVGVRLLELVGNSGTAARIGGDEFVLLVPQPGGTDGASAVAQQVLQVLARPYRLPNRGEVKLSCSIGIALFPEHG